MGSLCRYDQIMRYIYIAVRNFVNGLDVIVSLSTGRGKLNDSKFAPESLCHGQRFFFRGSSFFGIRKLEGMKCLNTVISHARIVRVTSHIKLLLTYVTIIATVRNQKLSDYFYPLCAKCNWE